MIIGQDWLESASLMWVHWANKLMKFTHQGKRITLHGLKGDSNQCPAIKDEKLKGLLNRRAVVHCIQLCQKTEAEQLSNQTLSNIVADVHTKQVPAEVQNLLKGYDDVFQTPNTLPPPRPFDHHIHLIPGAQPVSVRPYRYSPL